MSNPLLIIPNYSNSSKINLGLDKNAFVGIFWSTGMECTYKPESFLLDRACKVQSSKQGRLFCEFSATQLRQLRGVYCNFTESDGSEDSGHCYFMPKLQTLLSVFREFANSQHGKEYSADCFIYGTDISFPQWKPKQKISKVDISALLITIWHFLF